MIQAVIKKVLKDEAEKAELLEKAKALAANGQIEKYQIKGKNLFILITYDEDN